MSENTGASRHKKLNIFGSIRAKYIAAFALLISIVVILLSAVISSAIMNYVIATRYSAVDGSAKILGGIICDLMDMSEKTYDEVTEDYGERIAEAVTDIAKTNDVAVVVTDRIGNVEFSYIPEEMQNGGVRVLHQEAIYRLSRESTEKTLGFSDLYGFYPQEALHGSFAIQSSEGIIDGIVIASVPASAARDFVGSLVRTLVLSFIWIAIAAVVIAVFISERIISPLKIMEESAKGVAIGNYDIRVPEQGVDNEVADLARSFNEMSRVVRDKETAQRNFLGSVSHDMRTPMTSIAGFVDGMLDGTIPQEKHEYYLKIVSAETHRLSRLVNSLLDITKIQSGEKKFNKSKFDICELLRLVIISMEKQIDEKELMVEFMPCDEKCIVFADSDGIHQVVYNLVHNAIKFANGGGTLRIGVEHGSGRDGGSYIITVYNTGKGIKKEELPYIFDRFFKADPSRGLDKTGVGLGLFIVKTILVSHGERVWVESEEEKSTCFGFTLEKHDSDKQ